MLLETPRSTSRTAVLLVGNEGLRLFLATLLETWQFTVIANPVPGCLALVEDGLEPPAETTVIRLSPTGCSDSDCLPLPVSIEDLWGAMESRFHRPPRGHLRMAVRLPANVTVRGEERAVDLHSLSDAGGRFLLERELASGERLALTFTLDEIHFATPALVIYSFASGEPSPGRFETGVIFTPGDRTFSSQLREQIILRYLQVVRSRIPGWAFATGLAQLDLSAAVHKALDHAPR